MYAILRFQKKTGGKLLNTQKHNERQKERYKSNPDIDRERSDENIHLKAPPPGGYKRAVLERTEKAGCRLRKDSVMMIETLITASPELFQEMSREEMMDFMKRAYTFVAERVGEENIVSAVIHLDEKTPHSAAEVGAAMGESRDMVFRYIRLTNLVPPLLDMVDEGKIALMPAERLSYLTEEECGHHGRP